MDRVFLDTSVVLTGAFRGSSWAARLGDAKAECTFLTSEYVLRECSNMLAATADSQLTLRAAQNTVSSFIAQLGAIVVADQVGAERPKSVDPGDQRIVEAAYSAECTVVCTYNLPDFAGTGIRAASPLGLLKNLISRPDWWALQVPILGERGTILIIGQISSLGTILESEDGTRVLQRDDAMIVVEGPGSRRFRPRQALPREDFLGFMFRYRESGDCEAAYWLLESRSDVLEIASEKIVLTQGCVDLGVPVPRLMFNGNFGFSASFINVSGVPWYVRDRLVPHVMRDTCLEGLCGSEDIRAAMTRRQFLRGPRGELLVAFPS